MSKTDKSIEILGEVIQTASIIGTEKTKQALIDARSNTKYLDKIIGDLIKKQLCKSFKISLDNLMNGTSKGSRTEALMIGYVLAKKYMDYRLSDIENLFKKDQSNISKAITTFNKLNSNNKQDKHLIDIYQKISVVIAEYKTTSTTWPEGIN